MLPHAALALLPAAVLLSAEPGHTDEACVLVDSQIQAAAAAVAVLEKASLPPAQRASLLLPIASELARLHALRSQVDADALEAAESRAASDIGVQQLALRLLRAMELCAASGYAGSPELEAAVRCLALAIEGENTASTEEQGESAPAE